MANDIQQLKATMLAAVKAAQVVPDRAVHGAEPSPASHIDAPSCWVWIDRADGKPRGHTSQLFATDVTANVLLFLSGHASDDALDDALDNGIGPIKRHLFGDCALGSLCTITHYSMAKNPEYGGMKRIGAVGLQLNMDIDEQFDLLADTPLQSIALQASYQGQPILNHREEP